MSAHRVLFDLYAAPFLVLDPGNAETVNIDRWGAVVPVVTTTAETRTLAQPTKAGLTATIVLDTDGGNLTLTVTGGFNADADTSITFADAGDFVTFLSVKVGSSYYWRVLAQEGTNAAVEDFAVDQLTASAGTITELKLGVQTIAMNDAEVALTAETLTGNILFVDPESTGASEDLLLPPEADCEGVALIIVNTGGEHIVVKEDGDSTTIVIVEDTETAIVACDGTSWKGGRLTTDVA